MFGEMKNGVSFKSERFISSFIFEPLDGFNPSMAQTKAVTSAITELHRSVGAEISTNSSNLHLGLTLVKIAL